jgi:hypothetical protein
MWKFEGKKRHYSNIDIELDVFFRCSKKANTKWHLEWKMIMMIEK